MTLQSLTENNSRRPIMFLGRRGAQLIEDLKHTRTETDHGLTQDLDIIPTQTTTATQATTRATTATQVATQTIIRQLTATRAKIPDIDQTLTLDVTTINRRGINAQREHNHVLPTDQEATRSKRHANAVPHFLGMIQENPERRM